MKDPEEAIEKVLAGLRNPDAPVGMERRILEALQDRAAVRSRSGWRRFRPTWLVASAHPAAVRSVAWGIALAVVFAVALAVPAIRRLGHLLAPANAPAKMISAPVASLPPAAPEIAAKSAQLPPRSGVRLMKTAIPKQRVNAQRAVVASESDSLTMDSLALDEMHAASHPAPPMPLTEQEKMLLRIAHKGDPVEFAELDPVQRSARDAEEKAEVQRFFVPGKTGDNE
jgi:hypothetical protein